MMNIEEIKTEIGMAVEMKEICFKSREESPSFDLMFQFWCGYEKGLCMASGKLKPSLTDSYYGIPYRKYYKNCKAFFDVITRYDNFYKIYKEIE